MLRHKVILFSSALFLSFLGGCASLEVARQIQSGRSALRAGEPKAALPHFEAAARLNPDYVTDFTLADIGVWTYVGRSYYEAGEPDKALLSFEKAKERYAKDHFARIYLGLLMSRNGRGRNGKAELEAGLNGLKVWLERVPGYGLQGQYWDPGNALANRVGETLAMLRADEVNWQTVRDNVVWLGANFDEEIDEVKRDEDLDGDDPKDNAGSRP